MGRQSGHQVGRAGEAAAARFLEARGYRILARNHRFRSGEIDVVAETDGCIVFVEVKTRTGTGFGGPAESVTRAKQRQLVRLAGLWLASNGSGSERCRFDVVTVTPGRDGTWECELIQNAFTA